MSPPAGGVAGGFLVLRMRVVVWEALLHHLLLLLLLLLLVQVSGGEVVVWYKAQVSQETLQAQKPSSEVPTTAVICAITASLDQDTHHLFCCPDDTACSLYGLIVGAGHNDSASGQVQDCWTWHTEAPSPPPGSKGVKKMKTAQGGVIKLMTECKFEGKTYANGEIVVDSVSCTSLQCQEGGMVTLAAPNPTNLSSLADAGCIFLGLLPMTFDDARAFCQNAGGDMYVAGNFESLQEYLATLNHPKVWVGTRTLAWLDGRPVVASEWGPDHPSAGSPTDCIAIWKHVNIYQLVEASCTRTYPVLCQKGVSYP